MPRQRREFKIYNENIDRTFTQHQTKIQQLDDSITLQATSITTVSGRVDTMDGNVSTLRGNVSTLQGNYNTLSGDLSDLDTQVQTNEARMIIESNGILSTVTSAIGADTVISTVNQTAGQYIIDSSKIDLRGLVTFSDLVTDGNTTISGTNITTGVIKDANSNTTFNLNTGALTIGSGSINLGNNFIVNSSGQVTIKSGSITLGSTSGNYFQAASDGKMTAYNATIRGTLTAESTTKKVEIKDGFAYFYGISGNTSTYVGKVGYSDVRLINASGGTISTHAGTFLDIGISSYYGGIAVQESSTTAANMAFYYDRGFDGFTLTKKLYCEDYVSVNGNILTNGRFKGGSYLHVENSSGSVGINHDGYGVALFNTGSNYNNYIRVGPDRVDVYVDGGFYVNGTRLA